MLAPVDDVVGRQTLRALLDLQLAPNRNQWQMQSDGMYVRAETGAHDLGCQQALLEWIAGRESAPSASPRRRRSVRRFARRSERSEAGAS